MSSAGRVHGLLVIMLIAQARVAYAQASGPAQATRASASVDARLGLAQTPFSSPTAHEIAGALTSLLLEAGGDVAPQLRVRVRVPLILAAVDQPAGGARAETTWGHPEAAALWRLREAAASVLLGRLALAVPLPAGDADLGRRPLDNQALLLASAQRGNHDLELYAPGRVSLTPALRWEGTAARVAAFGELKVPFMLAVARGERDPQTRIRPLAIATAAAAGVSASWWRLRGGAASWLTVDLLPAAEIVGAPPPRWTLTIDPELTIRIGDHAHVGLTGTVPIAGALSAVPAIGLVAAGGW